MTTEPNQLARRLGLTDVVVIGLRAMIGAGIFAARGPAAAAAGAWLLAGADLDLPAQRQEPAKAAEALGCRAVCSKAVQRA